MTHESLFSNLAIQLNPRDNVAIARVFIPEGMLLTLEGSDETNSLVMLENIPAGHKLVLVPIPSGGQVYHFASVLVSPADRFKQVSEFTRTTWRWGIAADRFLTTFRQASCRS